MLYQIVQPVDTVARPTHRAMCVRQKSRQGFTTEARSRAALG